MTKLYLDTSAPTVIVELDGQRWEWTAGRTLARDLLGFLRDRLAEQGKSWQDLREIHFFAGPGSFTGLRIGATVVNTLADQLHIPLYNQRGERLPLILPEYGRPANISAPKK